MSKRRTDQEWQTLILEYENYRHFVDFCKSINGLAALVESETTLALDSGALFLFTNKQREKCLTCVPSLI